MKSRLQLKVGKGHIRMQMEELARSVKRASLQLAAASSEQKNKALLRIAEALAARQADIIQANAEDIARSEREQLALPLLKRLKFDENKIQDVIDGIHSLIKLDDPVGRTLLSTELDAGLELYRISCPIGVIGMIFESRPDALVQISTLCLKSGNGVLLKGGSEAKATNRILADIIHTAAVEAGFAANWMSLLETRDEVGAMLKMDQYIDLLIPRGSNEFVQYIMNNSKIPVMGHADGICHCYVDESADLAMAVRVVTDAKTQYVSACNTTETILVHAAVAGAFLPALQQSLAAKQTVIVGCPQTRSYIDVEAAADDDWKTEYLDYKVSVKVVAGLEEAIEHINTYGSGHTDSIITENKEHVARFMDYVDAGNVFWNCSTRFSDGFRYGFGAEVGISTGKIHARGPVGLDGMLIYKYKLLGKGHIVEEYANRTKRFTHKPLAKEFSL